MKKLLSIIALTVLVLLPGGCSKSSDKAEELLLSVPKNTAVVGIINLERLTKESGAKLDGDKITLTENLRTILGPGEQAEELFASGAFELSVLAVYVDADAMCVTGFTSNPAKLTEVLGDDIVVRDNRFWACERTGSNARIADNAAALKYEESFAASDYATTLTDVENYDIRFIGNMQSLAALSGDRQVQMGMGLLGSFGGAKYFTFDLTSGKGKMEMELCVLNSDFKKIDIPDLPTIDLKGIEKLHGRMEIVGGLAVNEKLMTEFSENLPNLIGNELPMPDASRFYKLLSRIDGTIAMGGTLVKSDVNWEVAIPFASDKDAKEAVGFVNMFTEGSSVFTRQEENVLLLSNANLSTPLSGPQNLSALKGQFTGVVAGAPFFSNPNMNMRKPLPIKAASLTCGKKDGSQTVVLKIETTGNDNGLFAVMAALANN